MIIIGATSNDIFRYNLYYNIIIIIHIIYHNTCINISYKSESDKTKIAKMQ